MGGGWLTVKGITVYVDLRDSWPQASGLELDNMTHTNGCFMGHAAPLGESE